MRKLLILTVLVGIVFSGCTNKPKGPTLWIYTSLYNHVVQDLDAKLKAKFPQVEIKWYQSGSENVAAKVSTELLGGKTQADLLMTSDVFWYEDLKSKKALLAYDSPAAAKVPTQFKDPEHYWAIPRVAIMGIAYHNEVFTEATAPKSFADLNDPRFKNQIAMPSPLESGTTFSSVALLSKKLGWDYFKKLRANGAISSGGNSSVIAKLESKERPVGIVLLENVLQTRKKNPKIVAVYPSEGTLVIPGPLAITASTSQPELAKQVYDFLFSKESESALAKGYIHAISDNYPAPEGAKPWSEILAHSFPWSLSLVREIGKEREDIKKQFSKIMLE